MHLKQTTRVGVYGICVENGSILLIEKGDQGCYQGLYDLPGGGIEFGENQEEALRREFLEEVSMTFEKMELFDNVSNCFDIIECSPPFKFHHIGLLYTISGSLKQVDQVPEERFGWYPIESLTPNLLTPFANIAIQRLQAMLLNKI